MKRLLILWLLGNVNFLHAQSIGAYVISPAGATFTDENIQLQFSLGEPMNTLIDSSGMVISQGLLQTAVEPISTALPILNIKRLEIYPNPFSHQLTLDASYEHEKLSYRLSSIDGVSYFEDNLKEGIQNLPTKALTNGIYLLTITATTSGLSKTLLLVKS